MKILLPLFLCFLSSHAAVAAGAAPRYFSAGPGALAQAKARLAASDSDLRPALEGLVADANAALKVTPPSVMDKLKAGASGDKHDYASQAPYLWPDPSKPDGLPYIPRDGVVNPESRTDASDQMRLELLGRTVGALTLAYHFTGNPAYAEHAARCLRVWFLDPATKMNPNLKQGQAVPGKNTGRNIGIIEIGGLVESIDGSSLLTGSPAWTSDDATALKEWAGQFLDWLVNSEMGREEAAMEQNHGTLYDVRVVLLALHVGNEALARQVCETAKTRRIARQIEPDGRQPMELRRTKSFNYSRLNLNGLTSLATLAPWVGVDLWSYATVDGRSIRRSLDYMVPFVKNPPQPWPDKQIVPIRREEMAGAFRAAAIGYNDPAYEALVAELPGTADARFQLLRPKPVFPSVRGESGTAAHASSARPNVLFIAIDDLRTELGCYGASTVKTPNLDRFSASGLRFDRAFCQVPVCGASRASLMTSLLPTGERFRIADTRAEEDAPGAVTLPQVLREAGYTTLSNGKIFHHADDTAGRSWTEQPWNPKLSHSASLDPATREVKSVAGRGRMYESPDVPDNAYKDGQTAEKAIADLRRLKTAGQPFFLACGFIRPHMPFYAPKKYWDLYRREEIAIADNRDRPIDAPGSLKGSNEYKSYHFGDYRDGTPEFHQMMRHGYYASTSYVDHLVGTILAELERLELARNTIVVVWGDHGWQLGEHDFWGKHNTLFNSLRVPLIIRVPGRAEGKAASGLVGLMDLFPTLCELTGVAAPASLQGSSFARLFDEPGAAFRDQVYSRYGSGDAIVTAGYIFTRYTNGEEMLYDLGNDPQENRNVSGSPVFERTRLQLSNRLDAELARAQSASVPAPVRKARKRNEGDDPSERR